MENENKAPSREDLIMKVMAIVGFVVFVLLLAWLAVQVVRFLPSAFSSLANLAEDVNTPKRHISLDVAASHNVINSKSSTEIAWSDLKVPGTYTFSYGCVHGVLAHVNALNGEIVPVSCETPYNVPENTFKLNVTFTSTEERFSDVDYRITFTPDDKDEDVSETNKTLTVVNASIPLAGAADTEDDEDDTRETPSQSGSTASSQSTGSTQVQYRYEKTVTYTTPKSDPNGYTELAIAFIGFGSLDSKNRFVPQSSLTRDERGAIQFEVKNIGTKTSSTWSFTAELPSGSEYVSKSQEALKPQERSIVTIAFDGLDETGTKRVEVAIEGGNDRSRSNNSFSKSVKVSR